MLMGQGLTSLAHWCILAILKLIVMQLPQARPHQKRSLDVIADNNKGQIIIPTGGGKTLIMIMDCIRRMNSKPHTFVVVAPRILLAEQLCSEFLELVDTKNVHVMHVHSGETQHFSTTKPDLIGLFTNTARTAGDSCIIFTTYHSLNRIVDSGIDIDVAYFDEAHNACGKAFFVPTASVSEIAENCYFFTATPRVSRDPYGRGMNNHSVYGQQLEVVPAQELIAGGSIIPPTVITTEIDRDRTKESAAFVDADTVIGIIDELDVDKSQKILVAVPSSKILWNMLSQTDVLDRFEMRGYNVLHITSKHGAYVNRRKVNREVFFETLTQWGKDKSRKFVLFHYSILSEGMNVPGLTHCVLLRNLNIVEMAQTIGRVIRMDKDDAQDIASGKITAGVFEMYRKPAGFVTVPVYKNNGKHTAKRLQGVVDSIFVRGIPPLSYCS
jgi:superfamily II DNA or RNA helicase